MPRLAWRAWLLVCILALAACATSPPSGAPSEGPDARPPDRELTGRISVHYHSFASGKEDTVFANFDWSEHDQDVDLVLLNPLGQTIARIRSEPNRSTLTLSDGRTFTAGTPEALTTDVLGWTLPVAGLRAWLEGRTADPNTATKIDPDGTRRLVENGWTVTYPSGSPEDAPSRVSLNYPGPGIALELRIVVDSRVGS